MGKTIKSGSKLIHPWILRRQFDGIGDPVAETSSFPWFTCQGSFLIGSHYQLSHARTIELSTFIRNTGN